MRDASLFLRPQLFLFHKSLNMTSSGNLLILSGGQRRDRTADAGLFRAGLFQQRAIQLAFFDFCDVFEKQRLQNDSKA